MTCHLFSLNAIVFNSRNFSILLNFHSLVNPYGSSTIVEIFLYYLTRFRKDRFKWSTIVEIFLYYLTCQALFFTCLIYNSRNFSILLNINKNIIGYKSTIVEIFLYYLTLSDKLVTGKSTIVEIFLYYLTICESYAGLYLQ